MPQKRWFETQELRSNLTQLFNHIRDLLPLIESLTHWAGPEAVLLREGPYVWFSAVWSGLDRDSTSLLSLVANCSAKVLRAQSIAPSTTAQHQSNGCNNSGIQAMVWCCVVRRAAVGYHDSAFSDACTAKLNNSYTDLWKLFFPRATPANDPKGSLSEDFLCKFILGLAEVHTGVMDSKYDLLLFVIAVFYVRRRLSE